MTQEEQNQYDWMRAAAHSYNDSSLLLNELTDIFADKIKEKGHDIRSSYISSALLFALSCEIGLKALAVRENISVSKVHDLKALFDLLPEHIKCSIKDNMDEFKDNFELLIESNKKTFVEWRYFYEGGEKSVNITFLRKLSLAINKESL